MTITKDTILGDILDAAPETAPLFIEIGMHRLESARPPCRARRWSRPAMSTARTLTRLLAKLNAAIAGK